MTKFKVNNPHDAARWCSKIISPRRYWLHNKIGGYGWSLDSRAGSWNLSIDDEKQAILAILKFSSK